MTPLTVVIPYCEKDVDLTERLLGWIVELGENKNFSLMLAADSKIPKERQEQLKMLAMESFNHVARLSCPVSVGYPAAANAMFSDAANWIQRHYKNPFLWLEPDCIPLRKGWLHEIATAYHWSPRPFMGPFIHSTDPNLPKTHLNGVSVYPNNAWDVLSSVGAFKSAKAWDIASADKTIKMATDTPLIFQFWGEAATPPTFMRAREKGDAPHIMTPRLISGKAVLYHRCKDGSLIDILREDIAEGVVTIPEEQAGYWSPEKQAIAKAAELAAKLPAKTSIGKQVYDVPVNDHLAPELATAPAKKAVPSGVIRRGPGRPKKPMEVARVAPTPKMEE